MSGEVLLRSLILTLEWRAQVLFSLSGERSDPLIAQAAYRSSESALCP